MSNDNPWYMQNDPFEILGIPADSSEAVIRAKYLELIKKFPPDKEPEQFDRIQKAYEIAKDPLKLAKALLDTHFYCEELPSWKEAIDRHAERPPKMSLEFLLGLGNRTD